MDEELKLDVKALLYSDLLLLEDDEDELLYEELELLEELLLLEDDFWFIEDFDSVSIEL